MIGQYDFDENYQYKGDPSAFVWVTVDSIMAGVAKQAPDMVPFLTAAVGTDVVSDYASEGDIITRHKARFSGPLTGYTGITSSDLAAYLEPFAIEDSYGWGDAGSEATNATWALRASMIDAAYSCVLDGLLQASYTNIRLGKATWIGTKPFEWFSGQTYDRLCQVKELSQAVHDSSIEDNIIDMYYDARGGFSQLFLRASLKTLFIGTDDTNPGVPILPIPPIPDGVPQPPPLTGYVGAQGPPGPPGPPGQDGRDAVLDLPSMIVAYEDGDQDDQNTFKDFFPGAPLTTDELVLTFGQLSVPQIAEMILEAISKCDWTISAGVQWHFEPGTNSVHLGFEAPCTLTLQGDIYLGGAPPMTLPLEVRTITYKRCDDGIWSESSIDFPSFVVNDPVKGEVDSVDLIQTMFNNLNQLQECCDPCGTPHWKTYEIRFGNFVSAQFNYLTGVYLTVADREIPIDEYTADISWRRYGRFMWINEDATTDDGGYIRYSGQEFYPPNKKAVGFQLILNPGVSMATYIKGTDPRLQTPGQGLG